MLITAKTVILMEGDRMEGLVEWMEGLKKFNLISVEKPLGDDPLGVNRWPEDLSLTAEETVIRCKVDKRYGRDEYNIICISLREDLRHES